MLSRHNTGFFSSVGKKRKEKKKIKVLRLGTIPLPFYWFWYSKFSYIFSFSHWHFLRQVVCIFEFSKVYLETDFWSSWERVWDLSWDGCKAIPILGMSLLNFKDVFWNCQRLMITSHMHLISFFSYRLEDGLQILFHYLCTCFFSSNFPASQLADSNWKKLLLLFFFPFWSMQQMS